MRNPTEWSQQALAALGSTFTIGGEITCHFTNEEVLEALVKEHERLNGWAAETVKENIMYTWTRIEADEDAGYHEKWLFLSDDYISIAPTGPDGGPNRGRAFSLSKRQVQAIDSIGSLFCSCQEESGMIYHERDDGFGEDPHTEIYANGSTQTRPEGYNPKGQPEEDEREPFMTEDGKAVYYKGKRLYKQPPLDETIQRDTYEAIPDHRPNHGEPMDFEMTTSSIGARGKVAMM